MNFNRNLKKISLTTAVHTSSATSSPQSRTTGTNVKTATETATAAEVSTSTSVDSYEDFIIKTNFIYFTSTSCASASFPSNIFIPNNKKITQLNYSTGMCETKTQTRAPTPTEATTAEVMLPLTSMSSEQITLTSRINIMDKDVENNTVAATLTNEATEALLPLPPPPPSTTTITRKCLPILATSIAKSCRKQCLNIKMPLRRLILTIMAAVVFSMEFTICSSSSILQHQFATMPMPNSTDLPTTARENKFSKINDNLQNLPVTLTTLATTSTTTDLFFASPVPLLTSSDMRTPLKSFESAALVESTSSLLTSTFDDSSSLLLSSLTGAATITYTKSPSPPSSIAYDADDGFSESLPTSISNKYDASDLPPLSEAEQAAKDLLTKGFSIPTYLPPFPVFAVADLPAYLSTVSTTTTESPAIHPRPSDSYEQNSVENHVYFDNLPDHQQLGQRQHQHRKLKIPKRNSSVSSANVTVQVGNHAYLPCHLHRLQNKPVSWVRLRDGHIISVDQTTFIADQRFQAIFQDDKEFTWSLQIKYVQHTDEGWYECQASSEPKMSARVYLNVIVPLTELIGDQSRFVKAGSKVALHCIVRGTLDPPQYIIWYRDKIQISEDNVLGWYTQLDRNIFGNSGDNQNTIGSLIIPFVRKMDSGNYTCQPSNSVSVSVDLHVLSGEYSASAIMSAARTCKLNDYYLLLLLFLLMLLQRT